MLAYSHNLDDICNYSRNVGSGGGIEREKLLCDPYCFVLLFRFDCEAEISRETITINAYATGSEAITPPCRHLTQDAIVLENKVQEILHGVSVIILFLIS